MSSPDRSIRLTRRALGRIVVACALSGALAGCFQPLYGEHSAAQGAGPALLDKLRDVEVMQIQGRLGNELRNDLIYAFTGGEGNPKGAPLQMIVTVDSSTSTALLNSASGLPENQIIRVVANWRIVKAGDEKKKPITEGSASGTATIDTSAQRFANYSAGIDAEKRAARSVADQIKAQLIAYFIRTANAPGSAS